ncbi:hypothetical protein AVEN_23620-1 [Araneus ventricosus]|uniref:HTH psq-type domain-containing protein n=1 Tax=Araneus ventricosus TaxID=182803 RepID=A0A4Y2BIK7_ARAVE|nr:hypothetical protein AVEN_23620-1 [Araneus ventricosus]
MPKRALSFAVASGSKREHVTLSIKDKVNLIKKLESGRAVAKLCEECGLGKSAVYDIKREKKELFEFFADSDTSVVMDERKIIRHAKNDDHDRVMIEWVRSMNASYTIGWLTKFKKGHGIRQLKICGDRESADAEASEDFANEFISLVEAEK